VSRRDLIISVVLVGVVGGLMFLPSPAPPPALVQRYGGERLRWTAELREEWRDVMECVGLDTTLDKTVRLYLLNESAPPLAAVVGGLPNGAWYDPGTHAIIVRADNRGILDIWRHEFIHARWHDPRPDWHPALFDQYATACRFTPSR